MNDPPIKRHLYGWEIVAQYRDGKWYVQATQDFWNRIVRATDEDLEKALRQIADESDLLLAELSQAFRIGY